jgi:hypothetical protein
MDVFSQLFNDFAGWLTPGVIVFMLVYLFTMFISKSKGVNLFDPDFISGSLALSKCLRLVFETIPVNIGAGE